MRRFALLAVVLFGVGLLGATAYADVIDMDDGLTSLETVPVGNLGNAGEPSGNTGEQGTGYGPYRICGAVDYAYSIGKYAVTAGQYAEFLNKVGGVDPYGLYITHINIERYDGSGTVGDHYKYRVAPNYANRPVNYVSWGDAARFANWLHNGQPTGILTGNPVQDAGLTEDGAYYLDGAITHEALLSVNRESDWRWAIPTEDEWYKAAYHKNDGVTDNYFDYPTSSDSVPGYVNNSGNLSGTGNPFTEGGTDPGNYATYNGDGGGSSPLTEVGEWENSDSPYGTFDQGGNTWEWNETILYGGLRGTRGSSFGRSWDYHLHASYRGYHSGSPNYENGRIGFRVATSIPRLLMWDNGSGNSNWATAANWEPDYLPNAYTEITIANGDTVLLDSPDQEATKVNIRDSTLQITNLGQLTVTKDVNIGADGRLRVDGTLTAASVNCIGTLTGGGTVAAPVTVEWGGTVSPGDGIGTLSVSSIALQPGSTLSVELNGSGVDGLYDQLDVAGELNLAARGETLALDWAASGPASKFGGDYVVATYESLSGEFETVGGGDSEYSIGEAYVAGVGYETGNQITVSLHPLLDGDADLDGKVWLSDWAALRANFGNSGTGKTWTDGNFDPWVDGKVWLSDWAALRANFGNSGLAASGAAAVPEPGTLAMLLGVLAGLGVCAWRRRR